MNKRSFLKSSGALLTGTLLSGMTEAQTPKEARTNWSGNYKYSTDHLEKPKSVEELQQVVKKCDKLRALGARHSFNRIADSSSAQVSLENLESMTIDKKSRTVTVGAGVRYGKLAPYLQSNGFAVHNLASLPHVTVVGACATATHGSGSNNGNLSTAVSGLEFVTAKGDVVNWSRHKDGERFCGAVVGLGTLGIVSKITLNVIPTFDVSQVVYENLPFSRLEKHLDEIFESGYSVSLFTDWQNHRVTQVWIKRRIENGKSPDIKPDFFGAKLATHKLHPLAGHSAENCTEQMGIPGPWYERLPHFRMNFTPSSGAELQSEYFVPREKGYQAILAVEQLRDKVTPNLFVTEFRTIAADDLWMSPCHERAAMALHFTWKPEWQQVKDLLPQIEEKLKPFDARPHWAKLFSMEPSRLQSQYSKLNSFKDLLKTYDPRGKFRNHFIDMNLYGS